MFEVKIFGASCGGRCRGGAGRTGTHPTSDNTSVSMQETAEAIFHRQPKHVPDRQTLKYGGKRENNI